MYGLPHGIGLALNFLTKEIRELQQKKLTIAIDGNSSSGKSTLARDLSKILQIVHIDSGAMYRAVTLHFIRREVDLKNLHEVASSLRQINITFEVQDGHNVTLLNGEKVEREIREMAVSEKVSDVAAISEVRRFLVRQQRLLADDNSIIMDGRDIGTVVFPSADIKLFVTASLQERTNRRHKELIDKGIDISIEKVASNLFDRDQIDSTRKDSPLKQASDAILLDTTKLSRAEMISEAVKIIFYRTRSVQP